MKNALIVAAMAILTPAFATAQSADAFTHVAGNVYYLQNGSYNSLVVVTEEGTLVVDPNGRTAQQLQDNLPALTDQPVTHLIFSHSHGDHASGGDVYGDDVQAIAHSNAPATLGGVGLDAQFDQEHSVQLGKNTIELTYLGSGDEEDMIATVVRPENVVFLVDVAAPERMFYTSLGGDNVEGWYQQILTAEALEFDIFVPGHGRVGNHDDLTNVRLYMEELRADVLKGLQAGKSTNQLVEELIYTGRNHWQQYEAWRPSNVRGMAQHLINGGVVDY
ncbi:MBL fold metallo-hydrolase [Ruegeria sp. Alg231-54]|uniref:MBL fold metallo-hydrolase n=1 Tax=Ruegeria sp. Alg231-54 TaxID=1922221 RepID=UPI000D553259|nr:MBL fold metallo-hydrolase [Ruegeria sp. Alg231-54]